MDNAPKFGIHGFPIQCFNLQDKFHFFKSLKMPLTLPADFPSNQLYHFQDPTKKQ